jgi:hypothetical protein
MINVDQPNFIGEGIMIWKNSFKAREELIPVS